MGRGSCWTRRRRALNPGRDLGTRWQRSATCCICTEGTESTAQLMMMVITTMIIMQWCLMICGGSRQRMGPGSPLLPPRSITLVGVVGARSGRAGPYVLPVRVIAIPTGTVLEISNVFSGTTTIQVPRVVKVLMSTEIMIIAMTPTTSHYR